MKIDEKKIARLTDSEELLSSKYGKVGSETRSKFHDEAQAWYFGEIVRDRRKELNITQKRLAEMVGTARSYIARVESGNTDIQMSSFFKIAHALGIAFTPVFAPMGRPC